MKKKDKVIKVLSSSGTTGSKTSKIYLDKKNALNQVKVLQKIINKILGSERLPMLIIDKDIKNFDRSNFNARIAAIKRTIPEDASSLKNSLKGFVICWIISNIYFYSAYLSIAKKV